MVNVTAYPILVVELVMEQFLGITIEHLTISGLKQKICPILRYVEHIYMSGANYYCVWFRDFLRCSQLQIIQFMTTALLGEDILLFPGVVET